MTDSLDWISLWIAGQLKTGGVQAPVATPVPTPMKIMACLDIHSNPPSSSDEGSANKENLQYAVMSCTRQLVKSEEVLQV